MAIGYFRNILVSFDMINEAPNEGVFAEYNPALDLIPDSLFPDPLVHELTVFFLGLRPRSARRGRVIEQTKHSRCEISTQKT